MTYGQAQNEGYLLTEKELKKLEKQIIRNYQEAYNQIKEEIKTVYAKILVTVDPKDYYIEMIRFGRLNKLLEEIKKAVNKASGKNGILQINSSKVAITNNYYRQLYINEWVKEGVFSALNPDVIDISVFGTPVAWEGIRKKALEKTWGPLINYQSQAGTLTQFLLKNKTNTLTL